jgi:hypothetical protein
MAIYPTWFTWTADNFEALLALALPESESIDFIRNAAEEMLLQHQFSPGPQESRLSQQSLQYR